MRAPGRSRIFVAGGGEGADGRRIGSEYSGREMLEPRWIVKVTGKQFAHSVSADVRAAAACTRFNRSFCVPESMEGCAWQVFSKFSGQPGLSVSLQLVREADLRG